MIAKSIRIGVLAAASTAALLVSPSPAVAQNGGNWDDQWGPVGQGCYAWTNWTTNHVTGHVYSQAGDHCNIEVYQWWRSGGLGGGGSHDVEYTTGAGSTATTPQNGYGYYYYGPSGNDYLCVTVYTRDVDRGPAVHQVVYGTGCGG